MSAGNAAFGDPNIPLKITCGHIEYKTGCDVCYVNKLRSQLSKMREALNSHRYRTWRDPNDIYYFEYLQCNGCGAKKHRRTGYPGIPTCKPDCWIAEALEPIK